MRTRDFGWCFIGSGGITGRVLPDMLNYADGSYPAAVYSKTYAHAVLFAEKYGAAAYETAEEALSDPRVRAAYVCTTNPSHKKYTVMALNKGIPVICEKPAALNASEAREMIEAANRGGTYFMEAMWMRHNPVIKQVVEWVEQGCVGAVRSVSASFSFSHKYDPDFRIFDPRCGGGALLDVGVYAVAFTRTVIPEMPVSVKACAGFTPSGVDAVNAMIFRYADGAVARVFSGIMAHEPDDAYISGENGYIHVPRFWAPKKAVLNVNNKEQVYEAVFGGEGFQFEFDAAKADILAGKRENALVTHRFTLDVMDLLDKAAADFTI